MNLRTVLSPVRTEETYYSMTEGIKSRGPKHRPPSQVLNLLRWITYLPLGAAISPLPLVGKPPTVAA